MEENGVSGSSSSSSCSETPDAAPGSNMETGSVDQELTPRRLLHDAALAGSLSIPQPGLMQLLGRLPSGFSPTNTRDDLETVLRSIEEMIREQLHRPQVDDALAAAPGFVRALLKSIKGKLSSSEAMGAVCGDERLPFQVGESSGSTSSGGEIILRELLWPGRPQMNKDESVKLFRRIVKLVDLAHSQQDVLLDLIPSFFHLNSMNKVGYIGSFAKRDFSAPSITSRMDCRGEATPPLGPSYSSSTVLQLERRWYTCPEELTGVDCSAASNIYSLGVLLFELLCCFDSLEAQSAAILSLRDRILPPKFISEYPMEAGFCLWLLHPDHASRPTVREILQSELLSKFQQAGSRDVLGLSGEEDRAEAELLLHFLDSLKVEKKKQVAKLVDDVGIIEEDLKEIHRLYGLTASTYLDYVPRSGTTPIRNLSRLEEAYFAGRSSRQAMLQRETDELNAGNDTSASQAAFFDGFCKFAQYSKIEERGSLRSGNLFGAAQVIRSVEFNRDEDCVAIAGISKMIKIYGVAELLDSTTDVHYPTVEMSNNSKLSCICWNRYMRNYIASADYDGSVQIWDANTAQGLRRYLEHQKRAWAVDFSLSDPARFASSSDDCTVKLWHINERNSTNTICSLSSICCVQFSPRSAHLFALGCADHMVYCYDMRRTSSPWMMLDGHKKTVSYLKFLDSESIVSASTDNTLKLWNIKHASWEPSSRNACALTLRGHTNEKNFVGLAAWDGYVACGSETNKVFTYYKSMPTPLASFGFGSLDAAASSAHGNEEGHFVSSVCWGQKQRMLLAANSAGNLKVLQMV